MQRVQCVKYSLDAQFLYSGSDDGNVRLWKANASKKLGVMNPRENAQAEYNTALRNRYKHLPEIRKVDRARRIPVSIKKAQEKKKIILDSRKRKEENVRTNNKGFGPPRVPLRQKMYLAEEE